MIREMKESKKVYERQGKTRYKNGRMKGRERREEGRESYLPIPVLDFTCCASFLKGEPPLDWTWIIPRDATAHCYLLAFFFYCE